MTGKSRITTHVLDTSKGRPAGGIAVRLEKRNEGTWTLVTEKKSDADGRVSDLAPGPDAVQTGTFRITFETGPYFKALGIRTLYPFVEITFDVDDPNGHYHLPLLLSPFGYSTYRGS